MGTAARDDRDVSSGLARTALSNRIWTGVSRAHLAWLVTELAPRWVAAEEDRLLERRGHERERAAGAGPDHDLPFTDRVIAALVHLRFQLPHKALAELYRVDRSTVRGRAELTSGVPGCVVVRLGRCRRGGDGVVPVTVEVVPAQMGGFPGTHFLVGDPDAFLVGAGVEHGADFQPGAGRGGADGLDDDLVGYERAGAPVEGDEAE